MRSVGSSFLLIGEASRELTRLSTLPRSELTGPWCSVELKFPITSHAGRFGANQTAARKMNIPGSFTSPPHVSLPLLSEALTGYPEHLPLPLRDSCPSSYRAKMPKENHCLGTSQKNKSSPPGLHQTYTRGLLM